MLVPLSGGQALRCAAVDWLSHTQVNESSSSSAARFGGGIAGTAGGTAPRSAVLLAQMRSRQAAINAAASTAARNDLEVREMNSMSLYVVRPAHAQ